MRRLLSISLAALACSACATSPTQSNGLELVDRAPCAPDEDAPKGVVRAIGCVASIDGQLISPRAFDAWAVFTLPRGLEGPTGMLERMRAGILTRFVDVTLLHMDMAEAGFAPSEAELASELGLLQMNGDPKDRLRDVPEGVSLQEMRAWELRQASVIAFVCLERSCGVTEEESRAFYDTNVERFEEGEQVRASHILIKLESDATPPEVVAARQQAAEIAAAAQAPGADFAELARQRSMGPSASRGGDLGFFPRGRMVQPFDDMAFGMAPGEVSGPVRTAFGWHVILVSDRKPARTKAYEEVRGEITRTYGLRKRSEAYKEAVRTARERRTVEELLDRVVVSAPVEAPPAEEAR